MAFIDSRSFLSDGGYLQKGVEVNLSESDLENKVHDLLPGRLGFTVLIFDVRRLFFRWYRDEKIFQLERRAIFSRVRLCELFCIIILG